MAALLQLPGADTLQTGEYTHFSYKNHPLTVRVNRWGEVEHIGLRLFHPEVRLRNPLPVYDFLERYMLECDLLRDTPQAIRHSLLPVFWETGTEETAFQLDGSELFRCVSTPMRSYRVEWLRGEKVLLALRFEMDMQLLTGCDDVELEQNFLKRLKRFRASVAAPSTQDILFPETGFSYIWPGKTFRKPAIRNDLYFQKGPSGWALVFTPAKPLQSLANLFLTGEVGGDTKLALLLDSYGYREDAVRVKYSDWFALCVEEGCAPYWGMKRKTATGYEGTLFMVNERCGFVHILRVECPSAVLAGEKESIEGRLYVYVPLQHVAGSFIENEEYKRVEDEKD